MTLQTSARKLAAIAVTGAVVVIGGSAFAEELMPADPVVVEETPAEEPVVEEPINEETPAEEPVVEEPVVEEAPAEEPVVLEDVVDEPAVLEDEAAEDVEDVEDTTVEEPVVEATHPANHGAAVSEAAHAPTPEGARNHGEAVSAVARSNAGKPEAHGNGHNADE